MYFGPIVGYNMCKIYKPSMGTKYVGNKPYK